MSVILFASSTPFVSAHGGAQKANRVLGERLAARGHAVHFATIARRAMRPGETLEGFLDELRRRGIDFDHKGTVVSLVRNGVHVEAVDGANRIVEHVAEMCAAISPDAVIVSSEDWRQRVLLSALTAAPGCVVYQGRTLTSLPFGQHADDAAPDRAALVARAAALVAPCAFYARYMEAALGRKVEVIHNIFDEAPAAPLASRRLVTLINPCAHKGLSIFVALAERFSQVAFGAVPTWGTSAADLAALARVPNVEIVPATDDIDGIYAQTRVLLVPSLWPEGLSNVVVEAMLRGIPVLCSDVGGLAEAALGVSPLLPVCPIERFRQVAGLPIAREVPAQQVDPWAEALVALDDAATYAERSARGREAALAFARSTSVAPYEALIARLAG
jgi:glycosyltransferase involved in cell wall biosynthesis